MLYPIAIEPGDDTHAYGVTFPDVPGCFSAGDTLDEAWLNAKEALESHFELLAEDECDIPMASSVNAHAKDPEYAGYIWGFVDIDVTPYLGKSEKINVSLPASLTKRIDALVKNKRFKSRSGFLAQAALEKLNKVA